MSAHTGFQVAGVSWACSQKHALSGESSKTSWDVLQLDTSWRLTRGVDMPISTDGRDSIHARVRLTGADVMTAAQVAELLQLPSPRSITSRAGGAARVSARANLAVPAGRLGGSSGAVRFGS
jgi:hypothetical protein